MDPAVVVDHVSKQFKIHHERHRSFQDVFVNLFRRARGGDPFDALKEVSFKVEKGEAFGIIGENGSGKSTLLKLMTGILEPTSGRIDVHGRVSALLELGAGFHPDLTGRDNIYLNASILGFSRKQIDAKYDDIVEFAGIEEFIDTPLKHYSSGMQIRLGFAVAVNTDPDVLIADEVLSVGDELFQRKCIDKIDEFMRQGKTIILVSHGLELVRYLCNRAAWLEHGVLQMVGPAVDVIDAYLARANLQARKEHEKHLEKLDGIAEEVELDPRRWGSREVELTKVELLDLDERPCNTFETAGGLIARLHYYAKKRVEHPVFGVAIHYGDTIHLNGPNSKLAGLRIDAVEGTGVVDYVITELPLLRGTYHLSAAVYDNARIHAFDHHDRKYTFRVQQRRIREDLGIIYMPSEWHHRPFGAGAVTGTDGGLTTADERGDGAIAGQRDGGTAGRSDGANAAGAQVGGKGSGARAGRSSVVVPGRAGEEPRG